MNGSVRRPSATDGLPRSPVKGRFGGDTGSYFHPPPPIRRDTGLGLRSGSNGPSPGSVENYPPPPQLMRASTFGDTRSFGGSEPTMSSSAPPFQPPLPQRRPTVRLDSDESDGPPVTASTLPPLIKGEFPDPSNINRRPPYFGFAESSGIDTKLDTRQIDICGRYAVTTGFFTKVWDVVTGNTIMTLSHQETNKCSCVIFKPAANFDEEGKSVWLGTITGEIMEIDISTQLTTASRQLPTRRDIVKLYPHKREVWALDGDGTLYVFAPDESSEPNLLGTFLQAPERVPRGMTHSMVVDDYLWYMIGKETHIYDPSANDGAEFRILKTPITFNHAGDVTAGAFCREHDLVYLGHADGKISMYSAKDLTLQHSVASSVYKVSALVVLDNLLWTGYTTGTICVFDTSKSPWLVKKEWQAHKDGICSMILDTRSLAKLERLQIASLGVDKHIRIWDGFLHEDWIEERMHSREEMYCGFEKITAAVLTWNAGASTPSHMKDNAFIRDAIHPESPPDIIIFGFQELVDLENKKITAKSLLKAKKKDKDRDPDREQHMSRQYRVWKEYLSSCIDQMMPVNASYTHLHTANLIGLFTCVFVRDELRHSIKDLGSMQVKRGMGGLHGNKGALVLRFLIEDTSICLVNCHLAAGQTHTGHRNSDIAAILETGALPVEGSSSRRLDRFVGGGDGSQILDHEVCIINGDLNYRIDSMPRNTVVEAVKKHNLTKLLDRDQLLASRRKNPIFRLRAFREEPITFAPTYKYDVGSDRYDTSEKKRAPAWCDRLLYRGAGRVKQIEYRRHENMASDHRPVSGVFRIRIKTVRAKERAEVLEMCRQEWTGESKRLRTIIR
ncbi:hypothetical protein KEM56_002340 [Ascosphaera pollenicola]|nr:hypothetical protein KEM56_002340 [Ascosphaera pollenicola]